MLLFYTTEDIRIRLRDLDQRIELRAHPRAPSLSPTRVYCTTRRISLLIDRWIDEHGRNGVLHKLTAERAALAFNLPPYLGGAIPGQRTLPPLTAMLAESRRAGRTGKYSLGAFNGLGGGIGDTITGLCALRCARDHVIAAGGPDFTTDLIVDPDAALRIEPIVRSDPLVRRVMTTPQPISTLQKYDGVWDFDSLLFDPRFDDTPLVDYFLDRMGVPPASVDPADKNARLQLPNPPKKLAAALAAIPGRTLMFHPTASANVRSIPDAHVPRIVADILRHTDDTVISVSPLNFTHPRVVNLAPHCDGVLDLCHIVARANRVVTVDTSVCHIAAAFGVPTVALFTTIAPGLRVKYYPSVAGILLDGAERTGYLGAHMEKDGLPPEPVFALWEGFDVLPALSRLDSLLVARR